MVASLSSFSQSVLNVIKGNKSRRMRPTRAAYQRGRVIVIEIEHAQVRLLNIQATATPALTLARLAERSIIQHAAVQAALADERACIRE